LTGPSLSVDTACSSSLVATRLAQQALTEMAAAAPSAALVGGINTMLLPSTTGMFKAAGAICCCWGVIGG